MPRMSKKRRDVYKRQPQTIATFTRHQVGTVERALKVFLEFGLVEILTDGAYYMTDIQLLIGQSSTEGERKKKERMRLKRQKLLPSGGADICPPYSQGDICPPEIRDKRLDIRDKSIENRESESARAYGRYQNVFLTDEELADLQASFPTVWGDVYKRQGHCGCILFNADKMKSISEENHLVRLVEVSMKSNSSK